MADKSFWVSVVSFKTKRWSTLAKDTYLEVHSQICSICPNINETPVISEFYETRQLFSNVCVPTPICFYSLSMLLPKFCICLNAKACIVSKNKFVFKFVFYVICQVYSQNGI